MSRQRQRDTTLVILMGTVESTRGTMLSEAVVICRPAYTRGKQPLRRPETTAILCGPRLDRHIQSALPGSLGMIWMRHAVVHGAGCRRKST